MKLTLTRRRKIALGSILALVLIWLLWPDRSLARVRSLRGALADKSLSAEDRDAKGKELRDAMQKLTPDQRKDLFADARKRASDKMERYLQLSTADKRKELDRQIDRQEEFRRRMQQQQGQPNGGGSRFGGFGGPGGPGGQGRPNTPEDREHRRQQRLDDSTPRDRELRDQFRRDMEQRRRERGLPPNPPGRGPR
jgi:hypothetical protein